jgi:hypothetical protein
MSVGKMIEATIMAPIEEMEKAIQSRDRAKFVSAFDNSPRHAIVVTRPRTAPSS